MTGFVKIYGSILRSSVWLEDVNTRLLWIALLAMADPEGIVDGAVPGIAHAANLPLDAVLRGLETLQAPDPHSKDPDDEGRRVEAVPGGFRVLNYTKYRESRSPEQVRSAERVRRWRERQRGVTRNACNAAYGQKSEGEVRSTEEEVQKKKYRRRSTEEEVQKKKYRRRDLVAAESHVRRERGAVWVYPRPRRRRTTHTRLPRRQRVMPSATARSVPPRVCRRA